MPADVYVYWGEYKVGFALCEIGMSLFLDANFLVVVGILFRCDWDEMGIYYIFRGVMVFLDPE